MKAIEHRDHKKRRINHFSKAKDPFYANSKNLYVELSSLFTKDGQNTHRTQKPTNTRPEHKKLSKLTKGTPTNLNSAMSAEAKAVESHPTNTDNVFKPVTPDDNPPSSRESPPGVKDPPQVKDVDMDQNNDDISSTSNKSEATAAADNRDSSQSQTTSRNNRFFALDPNAAAFKPNNNASPNIL